MRYPASEKLEIIQLVEESTLPVRRTLEKIGIPHATFYRWYDLYQIGGRKPWTTDVPGQIVSGTAFPTTFASASSNWRWTNLRYRRGNWPCASPTQRNWRSQPRGLLL